MRSDPREPEDHLAKAAQCIDRGDEPAAITHLSAHVRARPDAAMIRAYLAELLFQQGQFPESRRHFERFSFESHAENPEQLKPLVHCHTRLMQIAEEQNDSYREHLHRGIGLVLLVRQWDQEADPGAPEMKEQTLTKAAAALRGAVAVKAADPRALVYLAETYSQMGQASSARTAARKAKALLPDAGLTDQEHELIHRLSE
jgi:tetratricopeptide (TPR) repeat protein